MNAHSTVSVIQIFGSSKILLSVGNVKIQSKYSILFPVLLQSAAELPVSFGTLYPEGLMPAFSSFSQEQFRSMWPCLPQLSHVWRSSALLFSVPATTRACAITFDVFPTTVGAAFCSCVGLPMCSAIRIHTLTTQSHCCSHPYNVDFAAFSVLLNFATFLDLHVLCKCR